MVTGVKRKARPGNMTNKELEGKLVLGVFSRLEYE